MAKEKGISTFHYKNAGVDIDAGADLVEAIKPLARSTHRPGVVSDLGGFGALFDLKDAGYGDSVLVASTDGAGTKLKVAVAVGKHDTVGIDLVAMWVNDLVVQGAEPLFFLDYLATAKLDLAVAQSIVSGIAEGCKQAGCALIGGETAEMPGMYGSGDYDLAGFAVGAVQRGDILTGGTVCEGDSILGLASNGLHCNGFSLVRRVVEDAGLDYAQPAPFASGLGLGQALLEPTRIYVKSCLAALGRGIKALAHITGGGLVENIPRVLPASFCAEIDATSWTPPEIFTWLAKTGAIPADEMTRTFNCGIGMAVVAAAERAAEISRVLTRQGETVIPIGTVKGRPENGSAVVIKGLEEAWIG